jgi:predicted peptidase
MKKTLLIILAFFFAIPLFAQESYLYGSFSHDGKTLPYRYLEPQNIKSNKKYPVVLFLHGAGERGIDNEAQLLHCSGQFLNPEIQEKYPAYVFFPQAPKGAFWSIPDRLTELSQDMLASVNEPSWQLQTIKAMVDSIIQLPHVDPKRVYIMGISMGAMATYELCWRYPHLFAAAVPICGGADINRLASAACIHWRIYHGDADKVVPVTFSRTAYKALKQAGAKIIYREFAGCTHNSWNPAFNDPDLFPWLFKQKR